MRQPGPGPGTFLDEAIRVLTLIVALHFSVDWSEAVRLPDDAGLSAQERCVGARDQADLDVPLPEYVVKPPLAGPPQQALVGVIDVVPSAP